MQRSKTQVLRYMRQKVSIFVQNGEVNTTMMAEAACRYFDDFETTEGEMSQTYFDLAYQIAIEYEAQHGRQ